MLQIVSHGPTSRRPRAQLSHQRRTSASWLDGFAQGHLPNTSELAVTTPIPAVSYGGAGRRPGCRLAHGRWRSLRSFISRASPTPYACTASSSPLIRCAARSSIRGLRCIDGAVMTIAELARASCSGQACSTRELSFHSPAYRQSRH